MCDSKLPDSLSYHTEPNTLFLLLQNATTLFAYWSLAATKSSMILEHFGSDWRRLQPTLRLYTTTGLAFDGSQAREMQQLNVYEQDSVYIQGLKQGQIYVADLGIWNKHMQFIPLLRSNSISIPLDNDALAPVDSLIFDEEWLSGGLLLPYEYDRFSAYTIYSQEKTELPTKSAVDDDKIADADNEAKTESSSATDDGRDVL